MEHVPRFDDDGELGHHVIHPCYTLARLNTVVLHYHTYVVTIVGLNFHNRTQGTVTAQACKVNLVKCLYVWLRYMIMRA